MREEEEQATVKRLEVAAAGRGGGVVPEEGQAAGGAAHLIGQGEGEAEGGGLVKVHVARGGEGALHEGERMEGERGREAARGGVDAADRAGGAEAEAGLIGVTHGVIVGDAGRLEGKHVLGLAEGEEVVAAARDGPTDGGLEGGLLRGDAFGYAPGLVADMQTDLGLVRMA